MPYTDAWDNKGPLTYLLYAVGTGIDPDHGMLVVSVLNLLVVGVLAYRLALVLVRPAVAGPVVGVALGVLVHAPELTEALSLGFLLYLALVAARILVAGVPPGPVQAVLAGGCLAASTLLRANNALVLVPLCLVACVWLARGSMAALVRTLGWAAAGAVAVTAPIVLWLWRGGALGACLDAAYLGSLRWDLAWTTRVSNTIGLIMGDGPVLIAVWSLLLALTVRRAGRASRSGWPPRGQRRSVSSSRIRADRLLANRERARDLRPPGNEAAVRRSGGFTGAVGIRQDQAIWPSGWPVPGSIAVRCRRLRGHADRSAAAALLAGA